MNRTANNAIKVKYDGMNNITYECLKRGVIFADIGFDKSDMIMDIVPTRHYEGKTPNDEAKIGFFISIKSDHFYIELQEKIVLEIDGDRIEVGISEETVRKSNYRAFDEECTYSQEEIIGINGYAVKDTAFSKVLFDLQPKDIKRIAEAKNVCIYFDSNGEYNVNGGNIALRNGNGSCQIEGIQRAMKRAYHYFVDFANSDEDAELKKAQEAYDNKDYKTALYIWNQLAGRNNAEAFFNIGNCFYYGQGVNRDYTEAKNWFMQAGELGDVRAFMCLADFSESPAKAVEWWLKAAELGDAEACRNLAVFYETKNINEAIKWSQNALDNGYDDEDGKLKSILESFQNNSSNTIEQDVEIINVWADNITGRKEVTIHFDAKLHKRTNNICVIAVPTMYDDDFSFLSDQDWDDIGYCGGTFDSLSSITELKNYMFSFNARGLNDSLDGNIESDGIYSIKMALVGICGGQPAKNKLKKALAGPLFIFNLKFRITTHLLLGSDIEVIK